MYLGTDLEYNGIALSRCGTRLAGFGNTTDRKVYVWDTLSGKMLASAKLPSTCCSISFDPSDKATFACISEESEGLYIFKIRNFMESSFQLNIINVVRQDKEIDPLNFIPDDLSTATSLVSINSDLSVAKKNDIEELDTGSSKQSIASSDQCDWKGETSSFNFTAHVWGTESKLYLANDKGEMICIDGSDGGIIHVLEFNKNSETYDTLYTYKDGSGSAGGKTIKNPNTNSKEWRIIDIFFAPTHFILLGRDGFLRWINRENYLIDNVAACK